MMIKYLRYIVIIYLLGYIVFRDIYFFLPDECALDVIAYTAGVKCMAVLFLNGFIGYYLFVLLFKLEKMVFILFLIIYLFKCLIIIINIESFIIPGIVWLPLLGVTGAYILLIIWRKYV